MCVEERLWIPLEINLASRSIHIWDNGSSFFSDKKKQKQVEAYARSMPYIAQKKFPMVERTDDSPFNSSPFRVIHKSCFTQLKKIEDSGVYMVKIMESYAMSRRTNDEFHEHSIADIRKKLAVDIFAELGNS
ncbi:hypothetical protein CARUB_v10003932mg [Capsella rubella]|uniref:Ubiquitin-like protease family profile domain-containing protein n=1 Tax=Capsella rubella TaxID=81985 RepID=R0ESD6_9BRAS|nr:uncharacterized protein LOC17874168 [Capsella rubella]EOA11932.1 hypothetical protein CARUB_v10003932mg [Capsella rubella]